MPTVPKRQSRPDVLRILTFYEYRVRYYTRYIRSLAGIAVVDNIFIDLNKGKVKSANSFKDFVELFLAMWSLVYVGVPIFTHLHTVTNIWIAKTEQQIINIQRGVDIFFVRNISATAAHMHIFPAILKAVEKTSNECFFLYLIKNSLSGALDEKSLIIYWKTCTQQNSSVLMSQSLLRGAMLACTSS